MKELKECGQRLLDTAIEYHAIANKLGVVGAVIWLGGSKGELVIITRGEYKEQLLRNIEFRGPTRYFGHSVEEE